MKNLQNAVSLIDESIINMAHLQELPSDLFRGDFEESLTKAQRVISAYPEVKGLFKTLEGVYHGAITTAITGTSSDKTENYRFMLALVGKVKAKISHAEKAYHSAESDLQQSEEYYREMLKSHSISLLADTKMEGNSIDLAAINKTSAQQKMKIANNAITLLTLKLSMYKKIMDKIDLEIKRDYYRKTMNHFQGILKGFSAEFDKLKAAALLAYPNLQPHESIALKGGEDWRSSDYSEVRIDKRIYEIFQSLGNNPGREHETSLRNATQESLTANLGEADFTAYIDKQYQNHLVGLRSAAA